MMSREEKSLLMLENRQNEFMVPFMVPVTIKFSL